MVKKSIRTNIQINAAALAATAANPACTAAAPGLHDPSAPTWTLSGYTETVGRRLGFFDHTGAAAVADSPQFSAMSAAARPPEVMDSALALQTALGFAITMVSIQLGTDWLSNWGSGVAWLLLPGPILGLFGLRRLWWRQRL